MTDIKPMTDEEIERIRAGLRKDFNYEKRVYLRLIATIDTLKAARDQARREALDIPEKLWEKHSEPVRSGGTGSWEDPIRTTMIMTKKGFLAALAAKEHGMSYEKDRCKEAKA